MEELPPGASRPRFMGHAGRDDVSRYSLTSTLEGGGPASVNSSVYALNPAIAARSSTHLDAYHDDPNADYADSRAPSEYGNVYPASGYLGEKRQAYLAPRDRQKKKWGLIIGGAVLLIVVAAGVIVPLYFFVIKPKNHNNSSDDTAAKPSSTSSSGNGNVRSAITGGDGSTVTTDDGSTFTYTNSFGGYWYFDPDDPFNNGARAQSWTPALNETFQYGVDTIRG